MKAHLRRVRISPKKANIVAGIIRRKPAMEALEMLQFMPKKAAKLLYKVLKSAIANAEQQGKDTKALIIEQIIVNKGPFYKRYLPSTRGRALPINKPTAHISIYLSELKSS